MLECYCTRELCVHWLEFMFSIFHAKRSLNLYFQKSDSCSKTTSSSTSLERSCKGGVRGWAPSFVEFSTEVRSWKAVLSWVEEVEMRVEQGLKAAAEPAKAYGQWYFPVLNASVLLAAVLGSEATDVLLSLAF